MLCDGVWAARSSGGRNSSSDHWAGIETQSYGVILIKKGKTQSSHVGTQGMDLCPFSLGGAQITHLNP